MDLETIRSVGERLKQQLRKVVIGQDAAIELLLVGLLSDGHVLLEGVPGIAKTLLARTFAAALVAGVRPHPVHARPDAGRHPRHQPLQLPDQPVHADAGGRSSRELLLADEINRTPPKTQAALLEAMQERAVTIDGKTHDARRRLHGGRDAEPDRAAGHLSAARGAARPLPVQACAGLSRAATRSAPSSTAARPSHDHADARRSSASRPVADARRLIGDAPRPSRDVRLSTEIVDYIVDLVRATREHPALQYGASPRAAACWRRGARAARRSTAATTSSPTTSRRWRRRRCATAWCCRRPPRSRAAAPTRSSPQILDQVAGAAMIRPTRRAVAAVRRRRSRRRCWSSSLLDERLWPSAWRVYLARPCCWPCADALLAPSPRRARGRRVGDSPSTLQHRRGGRADAGPRRCRPAAVGAALEADCELGELLAPPPRPRAAALAPEPGGPARLSAAAARRRGQAELDALWLRWRGPLGPGLSAASRRRSTDASGVCPTSAAVRDGRGSLLLARRLLSASRSQNHSGDGSEFDALRDYMAGHRPPRDRLEALARAIASCSARSTAPSATTRSSWRSTPAS